MMSPRQRATAMRDLFLNVLGEKNGETVWRQMGPALLSTARQLGDAATPEENFWKGVWKIHELD